MALSRTVCFEHFAAPDAVFSLLRNPSYLRRRCEADGDRNIRIEVQDDAQGVRQTIARDRTIELPAFVRGLIKPTNHVIETIQWQRRAGGIVAAYGCAAKGMPGTLEGTLQLERSAGGARYVASITVEAHVPLVGRKLEQLMADGFAAYLQQNAERDAEALRGSYDGMHLLEPSSLVHARS